VLVVEDDPDVREATSTALVEAGYSVVAASSGRAAIDQLMAGSCRPTTILLDLTMPIMDGREFMTELQRLPALSSVGVVLTSGQDDLGEVAAALGAGGYLRKPIGLDQLTQMVAALDQRVSGLINQPELTGDPPNVAEGAKGDLPAL
jgi:two-component system response regulator MprA